VVEMADKKVIGYTEQFGKVCEIVEKGKEIVVEETKTDSD
jgi:hypothetical protein